MKYIAMIVPKEDAFKIIQVVEEVGLHVDSMQIFLERNPEDAGKFETIKSTTNICFRALFQESRELNVLNAIYRYGYDAIVREYEKLVALEYQDFCRTAADGESK